MIYLYSKISQYYVQHEFFNPIDTSFYSVSNEFTNLSYYKIYEIPSLVGGYRAVRIDYFKYCIKNVTRCSYDIDKDNRIDAMKLVTVSKLINEIL